MENQNEKPRGRPRFYTAEERKQRKTDYMLHTPWFCYICKNNKNYTLAGKSCHLRTKKRYKNAYEYNNPGEIFAAVKPWAWKIQDEHNDELNNNK